MAKKFAQLPDRVACQVRFSDSSVDDVGTYRATKRGSNEPDLAQLRRAGNVRSLVANARALAWVHGDGRPRLVPVALDFPRALEAKRVGDGDTWQGAPTRMVDPNIALPVLPERVTVTAGFFAAEDWPQSLANLARGIASTVATDSRARASQTTAPARPTAGGNRRKATPAVGTTPAPAPVAPAPAVVAASVVSPQANPFAGKSFFFALRGRLHRVAFPA